MKKRLSIMFVAVVIIVVAHAIIARQCSPVKVTVIQTKIVDTVFVRDSSKYNSKHNSKYNSSQKHKKVELNAADSVTLIKIYGIGPVLSHRILTYRKQLGGFVNVNQLLEIKGIKPTLIEKFIVDSTKIQKININFATRNEILAHPYVTPSMAKRIEKSKLKGGYFNNYLELINQNILLPKEATKIAPYMSFVNN